MAPITLQMIRKRAEHNEGMVSTLEEVALHQEDIEKIEALGQLCRHLKIIYLQSNLIRKLENLHRLKELEYINLAVNNIQKIENMQRCESLKKIDLTVNFIEKSGLFSFRSLQCNEFLTEMYLMGNPLTEFEGWKEFIIATLPQLKRLDGHEIKASERIEALQKLPEITARLEAECEAEGVDLEKAKAVEDAYNAPIDDDVVYDPHETAPWSIETRVREHRELAKERERNERKKTDNMDKLTNQGKKVKRRTGFDPLPADGERVFQKNEGEWDFTLLDSEDETAIVLEVAIGKYVDTSLTDVDVQPSLVRMLCKGKLLQLALMEEVKVEESTAARSKASGNLVITMPKVKVVKSNTLQAGPIPVLSTQNGNIEKKAAKSEPKSAAPVSSSILSDENVGGGGGALKEAKIASVCVGVEGATLEDDSDSDEDMPPLG